MMALVTMTTGECDYGLGDDGDPRGQGERPEKANTKEEIWIVFIIIIMIIIIIIMIIIIITIVFLMIIAIIIAITTIMITTMIIFESSAY